MRDYGCGVRGYKWWLDGDGLVARIRAIEVLLCVGDLQNIVIGGGRR